MNVWVIILVLFVAASVYAFWPIPTVIKKRGGQGIAIINPSANTVRKIYDGKNHHRNKMAFHTHLYALNVLKGEPHFPTLLSANPSTKTVVTNYCGEPLNKRNLPSNWVQPLGEIKKVAKKYEIAYIDTGRSNFTVKDGTIYLVDLGHFSQSCYNPDKPVEMANPFIGDRLVTNMHKSLNN